jgi:hypothetical protein
VGAAGPGRRAAAEKGKGGCFLFFQIPIPFINKQTNLNSNQDLNPSTQKNNAAA